MAKVTFMGAGSTVFAKNVLGDCLHIDSLKDAQIALYDIDAQRLEDSRKMMENLVRSTPGAKARISAHLGVANRKKALKGADFVVNAIQVGGYDPCTITDFEIPKKYKLRQTIADTLGIGGIFRSLRTIPVVLDFARDMEKVCPDAWFLNYVNPMAMITGGLLRGSSIRGVGLCHSVQGCARHLLHELGFDQSKMDLRWEISGINHMAWLLSIRDGDKDLYPEIKQRSAAALARLRKHPGGGRGYRDAFIAKTKKAGAENWWRHADEQIKAAHAKGKPAPQDVCDAFVAGDMVRLELMHRFGHYITESSEHNAEYCSWFIKDRYPELIAEYNIPLDEYPRRCVNQIKGWERQRQELISDKALVHKPSHEFGAYIMDSILTDKPYRIHGSVMNKGLITNLPEKACVEVACLVDKNGVQPVHVGALPEQCAAMNMTNINVQTLVVEAVLSGRKDCIYQAAYLDPHTGSELSLDDIKSLCDDLIAAHGDWLPKFK